MVVQSALIYFCSACLCSALMIAALSGLHLDRCFVDTPDHRKIHHRPVPRIGGIALLSAFLLVLPMSFLARNLTAMHSASPLFLAVTFAGIIILLLGFFDDTLFVTVRVRHKLLVEIALALIVVLGFNIRFEHIVVLPGVTVPLWAASALSVFWIVGIINALNIIDGIDGLAGGIALLGFGILTVCGFLISEMDLAFVCIILGGATLGFLLFNFPPARIFMGDTGSMFLGFSLGLLSMEAATRSRAQPSILFAALFVGVPVLDIFVAMVRRFLKGMDQRLGIAGCIHKMIVPDNHHIHHRLLYRGLSHLQACLLLYAVAATMGVCGLIMLRLEFGARLVLLGYMAGSLVLILNRFEFGGRFRRLVGLSRKPAGPRQERVVVGVCDSIVAQQQDQLASHARENIRLVPVDLRHSGLEDFHAVVAPTQQRAELHRRLQAQSSRRGGPLLLDLPDNSGRIDATLLLEQIQTAAKDTSLPVVGT